MLDLLGTLSERPLLMSPIFPFPLYRRVLVVAAAVLVVVDLAVLADLVALGMVVVALLAADPVLILVREPMAPVVLAVLVVPMAPMDWDTLAGWAQVAGEMAPP
jgi:hypothetical protein